MLQWNFSLLYQMRFVSIDPHTNMFTNYQIIEYFKIQIEYLIL